MTLLVVLVVMPFQGHGWGYRYLHGMLGSMALLAAQGWIWLSNVAPDLRKQLACVLALSIALSVLALLPWRLAQVYAFERPPAAASAAIARSNSDVVIVDATNIWYGVDLVRNDPLLRSQPKVLDLASLRAEQVKVICDRYRWQFSTPRTPHAPACGLPLVCHRRPPAMPAGCVTCCRLLAARTST